MKKIKGKIFKGKSYTFKCEDLNLGRIYDSKVGGWRFQTIKEWKDMIKKCKKIHGKNNKS